MTPTVAAAASIFAAASMAAGQPDNALQVAQRILDFDESNPRALRIRAQVALDRGQLNQALTDARVLVRDHPDGIENRTLLARVFEARNDGRQAESTFRQALNDMPRSEVALEEYVAFPETSETAGRGAGCGARVHPAQSGLVAGPKSAGGALQRGG